jgi:hypothetical protein
MHQGEEEILKKFIRSGNIGERSSANVGTGAFSSKASGFDLKMLDKVSLGEGIKEKLTKLAEEAGELKKRQGKIKPKAVEAFKQRRDSEARLKEAVAKHEPLSAESEEILNKLKEKNQEMEKLINEVGAKKKAA